MTSGQGRALLGEASYGEVEKGGVRPSKAEVWPSAAGREEEGQDREDLYGLWWGRVRPGGTGLSGWLGGVWRVRTVRGGAGWDRSGQCGAGRGGTGQDGAGWGGVGWGGAGRCEVSKTAEANQ